MDDFLVKMIAQVEHQCINIDRECLMLRKLLRPWPKKKQMTKENPQETTKQAEEKEKDKNDTLTPSEKLALEEMDRLLNKAQKAIRIKEKIDFSEKSDATISNTNGPDDSEKTIKVATESKGDDMASNKSHIDNVIPDKGSKGKHIAHKREVPGLKKNPTQTKSSTKDIKSTQQQVSSRHSSSRNVTPRPLSAITSNSRPSSSQSRYTPAHMSAPFKTDMNTRVPNRKHNHVYKNHLHKGPQKKNTSAAIQKQQPRLNGLKTLPKIHPAIHASDNNDLKNNDTETGSRIAGGTQCNPQAQPTAVYSCTPCDVEDTCIQQKDESVTNESKAACQEHNIMSERLEQTSQEEFFSLQDKNSKIRIPQRLHKLVAENHALLEKCSTAKLVKKIPNTDAAHNFVERLNSMNEVSQELWTKAKALTCLQSHHLMLKCLNSLPIESVSEAIPFQEVYRTKRLLEFILTKFAQTQDEADYFSKVQFRRCQPYGTPQSAPDLGGEDGVESFFSNREIGASRVNDEFVIDALLGSKAWTQLQFEKDVHRLQLRLMDMAESEWWQILCQQPKNDSIVQVIHSLLTSCGEFFPAIVENPYL